ncbi:TRP-like ion channel Pkd2 [Balamuthia mandrillaris]
MSSHEEDSTWDEGEDANQHSSSEETDENNNETDKDEEPEQPPEQHANAEGGTSAEQLAYLEDVDQGDEGDEASPQLKRSAVWLRRVKNTLQKGASRRNRLKKLGRKKSRNADDHNRRRALVEDWDESPEAMDLCYAVRSGDLAAVVELVEDIKDVEEYINQKHLAKGTGNPVAYTPLQFAIKYGHDDIAAYLLDLGADPSVKSIEFIREEDASAHEGKKGSDIASPAALTEKEESRNAFHIAAQFGRVEMLDLMLATDAFSEDDILEEDVCFMLSLAIKCKVGFEVARLLFKHHIDISGIPREGTPERKDYETITKRSKRATLLYAIRRTDDVEFLRFLISDARQNVKMRTFKNTTSTHIAAKYGTVNTLRFLLKHGVDVDPLDDRHATPLCNALERLHKARNKLQGASESDFLEFNKAKKQCRDALQITEHLLDCNATLKYAKTSGGTSPLFFIVENRIGAIMKHRRIQATLNKTWDLKLSWNPQWWSANWRALLAHPRVLMLLTSTDLHSKAYYFEHSIRVRTVGEEFFIDRPFDSRTGAPGNFKKFFADTDQIPEIWTWITGPFFINFFSPESSFIMRYNRVVTNKVQLRQFRVEPGSCDLINDDYEALAKNGECYGEYDHDETESKGTFGPGGEGWTYSEPSDSESFISMLEELFPERGGYKVTLDTRDANATFEKLTELYENNWLDELTRGVFIEFTMYNPNINLFSVVRIMWDMPAAGVVFPSSDKYNSGGDWAELATEIIIGIWVAISVVIEIKEMIIEKRRYFLNGWNAVDVTIYLGFIVLAIFRFIEIGIIDSLDWEADDTDFVSFTRLARYRDYQFHTIAFILVLGWAKLLKFMRVHQNVGVLLIIVRRMLRALIVWGSVFIVFILSFSLALFLLLGSTVWSYRAIYWSMVSMFRTAVGDGDFDTVASDIHFGAIVLYLIYMIISTIMLLNLLIAMLSTSYAEVIEKANLEYYLDYAFLVLMYYADPAKSDKFKKLTKSKTLVSIADEEEGFFHSDTELEDLNAQSHHHYVPPVPPPAARQPRVSATARNLMNRSAGGAAKKKGNASEYRFGGQPYSAYLLSRQQASGEKIAKKKATDEEEPEEEEMEATAEGGGVSTNKKIETATAALQQYNAQMVHMELKMKHAFKKLQKKVDGIASRMKDDDEEDMLI